jgi:hypothetical protein
VNDELLEATVAGKQQGKPSLALQNPGNHFNFWGETCSEKTQQANQKRRNETQKVQREKADL